LLFALGLTVLMLVGVVYAPPTITQLTDNTAMDYGASISGDGSKIAFHSWDPIGGLLTAEIFVVNSDGTGLTKLTTNTASDVSPSISGDGKKIAFYSNVDGDFEIFVVNSDGSGLLKLTDNTAMDWFPSISGDGSKIAFTSDVAGPRLLDIFVVNSDGTGLTKLIDIEYDEDPSINDDGSKIAFDSAFPSRVVDTDTEIFLWEEEVDKIPPVISSVTLDKELVQLGEAITVTVEASDNRGLDTVTADGVDLALISGNLLSGTWRGTITAPTIEGAYIVILRATDQSGNAAEDKSAQYTVRAPPPPPPSIPEFGLSTTIITSLTTTLYLLIRRRRQGKYPETEKTPPLFLSNILSPNPPLLMKTSERKRFVKQSNQPAKGKI